MTSGAHDHPDILAAIPPAPDLSAYATKADVAAMIAAALKPSVPPPIVLPARPIASGIAATKDNVQMRRNGNGDVCMSVVKNGTGPITGVCIQDRFGTAKQVYHKGDGGLYEVAAVLSPDGAPIASTTWKPVSPGADAGFPTIMFDTPSIDIAAGTPFYIRLVNKHQSPDGNYCSLNTLLDRAHGSPRQWAFPDDQLKVLVNTGSGWVEYDGGGHTATLDVLPGHEGFAYTQALVEYFAPIGDAVAGKGAASGNVARQLVVVDVPTPASQIAIVVRHDHGPGALTLALGGLAAGIVSGLPISTTAGQDAGGEVRAIASISPIIVPVGSFYLTLSAPAGTGYAATPVRKALKGSYPTLTADWGSYMAEGYAESSSDGKTFKALYGNPNQTDLQFALLP